MRPILCVLDGSKALDSAVREVFDQNVLIQRCQVHKKRNVKAHLPESLHEELNQRLNVAYYGDDDTAAKKQLNLTVKWLEGINPSAIGSYLFDKHRIFTTPIIHEEFQGIRITPNLYTTLGELDRSWPHRHSGKRGVLAACEVERAIAIDRR